MESRNDYRKVKKRQKSILKQQFLHKFDKNFKMCYNEYVIEIGG